MSTAEIQQLTEDNEYLELKIKYIQSVATIFRQKTGLLVKELLSGRTDGQALSSALDSMMGEMDQAEETQNKSRAELAKPSLAVDGADYWREQFLSLMRDTKPSTLQDAQALCDILQEKNAISVRETNLKKEYRMLEQRHHALKTQFKEVVEQKALGADEAVRLLYKQRLDEIESQTDVNTIQQRVEEIAELRKENGRLESQNRVLRNRTSDLKNRLHDAEIADKGTDSAHNKIEMLTLKVSELTSLTTSQDAELRRYKIDLCKSEQEVALRELTASRLSGKTIALENEAEFALKSGVADVDSNELAYMHRQVDTFELHLRRLEKENKELRERNETLERDNYDMSLQQTASDKLMAGIKKANEYKDKTIQDLRVQLETREQHTFHTTEYEKRMTSSIEELSKIHCLREVKHQLKKIEEEFDKAANKEKRLETQQEQIKNLNETLSKFKEEISRMVKFESGANVSNLEDHIVNTNLPDSTKRLPPLINEITLRTDGDWKEVRDVVSGRVRYLKGSSTGTPFEPKKPIEKEPTPPSSPTRSASNASPQSPTSPRTAGGDSTPSVSSPKDSPRGQEEENAPTAAATSSSPKESPKQSPKQSPRPEPEAEEPEADEIDVKGAEPASPDSIDAASPPRVGAGDGSPTFNFDDDDNL